MKESSTEEIENIGTDHLKDKIEGLEFENNQLKEMVQTQMEVMAQRNSEIESLVNLVKGIIAGDGADSNGEDKMAAIREEGCADRLKEGDSSPKCDAGLELLRDLILEMSHEMVGLRMHRLQINELFGLANARAHQIEEQVEQIIELNKEVSRRENRLATANEKLVVLERELLNEQKKTELLEMWARKKDNKIESLTCEVQKLVNGKTQISEEVKHLREDLAAANVKIDRLQEDNCQKEKRILEVERRLEDLANKFEERNAKLKMEGQEERLREERHSGTELCKEIEAYKQQMIAELEHSKRRTKEASKEKLETSATLRQSSFGKELVIELGRLKEQLCIRKESKTPRLGGHVEMLATEDPRQMTSSGETDRVMDITECLPDKDLQEVVGSKDRDMQSLSEVIDHLLKLQRTEKNDDAAALVEMSRGKDVQTQLDKILECMCQRMCQSQPATEDVIILQNTILPAPIQEEEVLLDPKYSTDELISTHEEVLATKQETSSIPKEVLGTSKTEDFISIPENITSEGLALTEEDIMSNSKPVPGEPFIVLEDLGSTAQATPVHPEEPCLTPQTTQEEDELISTQEEVLATKQETSSIPKEILGTSKTIISSEDCLTPQAAPIVQKELFITKQRDAFHVEGAAISGDEQALHNDREALNMERLAQIREKEAFAAEREAFYREKEIFDEGKDAFQREMATFYKEKEEFHMEKEVVDREKEEFHMEKEAVDRRKEALDREKEALEREKEEFDKENKEREHQLQNFNMEKETSDREREEYHMEKEALDKEKEEFDRVLEEFDRENKEREHQLQDFKMEKEEFHMKKEALYKEKEEFHMEREALRKKRKNFI
ncbi:trichohyalin-like [Macrobrachium nipponense]|uniref:trichohyalin-like n=1 Tax=Macrobrachium nipponense TaxID=159736 RepID=UPI0030C7FD3C